MQHDSHSVLVGTACSSTSGALKLAALGSNEWPETHINSVTQSLVSYHWSGANRLCSTPIHPKTTTGQSHSTKARFRPSPILPISGPYHNIYCMFASNRTRTSWRQTATHTCPTIHIIVLLKQTVNNKHSTTSLCKSPKRVTCTATCTAISEYPMSI